MNCIKRTYKLTARHEEADGSFLRDNTHEPKTRI